ncbi:CoA transferase [Ramlibacter sp. PS3R-8]|uniref:CaiB/BaiF CoA transferase family protein n=1 Tax=Ramlibacter sp. PS3R-8 TaxID=3133437 RepID=UPI0030962992
MQQDPQTNALPLAGLRVLDLSRALAGPYCAMILADLGAEVIKVEPAPGGEMIRGWGPFQDGVSVYYLSIHRNKKSMVVNFRDPAGLALLREMARQVDIVVENFKPGAMGEMGLDYATLARDNPRLIFASITGFGSTGPYGAWPAVDQIAQGMSGLMSLTGQRETGPTRVGIPIGDVVGGMWGAMGVLGAVIARQASGKGQLVETSLLAGLIGMLTVQGQRHLSLGETPGVAGNDHPVICPYGVFQAQDGPFNMAATSDDMWARLCRLLGIEDWIAHPEYRDNTGRSRNREQVKARLNEKFAAAGKMHWAEKLIALGLPAGPIFTMDQVFEDQHVRQTGLVQEVEHPTLGLLRLIANPILMDALRGNSVRTAPPVLGADTHEVLAGFGLGQDRIAALEASGTIQSEKK